MRDVLGLFCVCCFVLFSCQECSSETTEAAVEVTQQAEETMKMTRCGSYEMYIIPAWVTEKRFVSMKHRLIEQMEEKIQGLEMQTETTVGFQREFEQMMEGR